MICQYCGRPTEEDSSSFNTDTYLDYDSDGEPIAALRLIASASCSDCGSTTREERDLDLTYELSYDDYRKDTEAGVPG